MHIKEWELFKCKLKVMTVFHNHYGWGLYLWQFYLMIYGMFSFKLKEKKSCDFSLYIYLFVW